jgi:hypothetical protein
MANTLSWSKSTLDLYRQNVGDFLKLSIEDQELLLDTLCGEGKFVYRKDPNFRATEHVSASDDLHEVTMRYTRIDDWSMVAKVRFFFGADFYPWQGVFQYKKFDEFAQAFPFGCSHDPNNTSWGVSVHGGVEIVQWCDGALFMSKVNDTILREASDAVFETTLEQLPKMSFSRFETCTSIELIRDNSIVKYYPRDKVAEVRWKKRADRMLAVLSQTIPYSNPIQSHLDEIIYPCLMNQHYRYHTVKKFAIPRPQWNRQRHVELSRGTTFAQTALSVLLMYKFRWANFPLHKDLVTMILGYVFDAHVAHVEETMDARTRSYLAWWNENGDNALVPLGLNCGIILLTHRPNGFSYRDATSDLYDLSHGISIPSYRMHMYRETFAVQLLKRNTDVMRVLESLDIEPDLVKTDSKIVMGHIMDFCLDRKISLAEVYEDTYEFSELEIADCKRHVFISSLRSGLY